MTIEALQTDQTKKTPVSYGPNSAPFFFRFGLDRSRDTQKSDQPGQDCISVQWTITRLSATLCDGVSQSFFGELAAAELSNRLSKFLLSLPTESNSIALHETVRAFLESLSAEFSPTVEQYSIEHVQPAFLRAVLEKKRNLGSEAVFTAVLLDKSADRILLIWSGDCRIRLWLRGEEVTRELLRSEDFITQERWSSNKGIVGNLHLVLFPCSSFDTIVSYSDGLSLLDEKQDVFQESNVVIEHYISQTKSLPSSDDVSFLQISMLETDRTHNFSGTELPALRVTEQGSSDFLQIQWQNLQQVQSWEVVANSETGFAKLESSRNVVKVPKAEISSNGAWLAYRGKTSNGFTPWSSWKFYKPPMSAKKVETEDSSQKLVEPETRLAPTRYQPLPINNSNPPTKSGPFRMPSYNGSTDRYPAQQTLKAQPRGQPSDRIWQVALLALLMGIFVLGSLLIFSEKQDEPELTLPVPRTTLIFRNPTQNPITVDSATAAPMSVVDTPEMTTIIEPIIPSSIVTGDRDISDLIKNANNNELTAALPTEDILLSRPIFRREIVYSKSK